MNAPTTPSALPSVVQQKMQRLRSDMTPVPNISPNPRAPEPVPGTGLNAPAAVLAQPTTPPSDADTTNTQSAPVADADTTQSTPSTEADRITLSREEYDELRANAGRAKASQAREQDARDRLEELSHRLTELENSNKAPSNPSPSSPTAAAPVVDTSSIAFTPEEREQYDESRPYIEKVVDLRLAERLNTLVPEIRAMVEDAKKQASTAVNTVQQVNTRSFHNQVKTQVPDLEQLIKHKHWEAFLDETEPMTGATYDQLLAHNVQRQNLPSIVSIYGAFRSKYAGTQQQQQTANAGFAGAPVSGGGTQQPTGTAQPAKLKLSDRKKASEDYRKGRIDWTQLTEINKQFDAAEKNGNIDYDA